MMKFVLGLILPGLLVVWFTRVTFKLYVGVLLTIALLIASIIKGYTDSIPLVIIDLASTALGYFYSKRMMERLKNH